MKPSDSTTLKHKLVQLGAQLAPTQGKPETKIHKIILYRIIFKGLFSLFVLVFVPQEVVSLQEASLLGALFYKPLALSH